ncbi:hypothetical protein like AT5G07670 [Hibiscus trionum]|uniref:F-box domain-containing protein n=1 Tax=Hibiscus trionum TaxID=183268 RepID=A0A9W7HE76_HIBTR|nr:hypothetical protein like AT5G07670 [Hibiscus trionum]
MQQYFHRPLSSTPSTSPPSEPDLTSFQSLSVDPTAPDYSSLLSDELLLNIFSKLPISHHISNSLVCKRWLYLHGRLVQSLNVADWSFVTSGRVFIRFPNLTDIDLVRSCIGMSKCSGIIVTQKTMSVHLDTSFTLDGFLEEATLLPSNEVDRGLTMIAKKYPNLQRLVAIGASEQGLLRIAEECCTLQELELHCCGDLALKALSGIKNLQVVKLIGFIDALYNSTISDIGLTLLAQGCRRLVKLELCGCEGSYDGVKAIGQCCQMLEELTLSEHRMDGGWLAGLSFCRNLKTLRLKSCKSIDKCPGADEHLGSCLTLEELHLQGCQIRETQSVKALFLVCENVRDIVLHDCFGLEDDVFGLASICRRVKLLSLEGCSLLTIKGLELVVTSWKELQRLRVMSCNNIKDTEITPELATLFSTLKELIWRPDSRSLLSSNLAGTGMGKKGDRFFKRSKD